MTIKKAATIIGVLADSDLYKRFEALGLCLAVVISWSLNKSIGWAFLHGILGWTYVVYYHWFLLSPGSK